MRKLVPTSIVLAAFGIIAACSQGDTHPPFIGDCDACNTTPISTGGGDATTDGSKPDVSTFDSSTNDATANDSSTNDSSTNDAGNGDGATNDGALLDSGVLD